jgi:hypothetical protein
LASLGIASSYAGQIQIGQTIQGVNHGLTTTWITSPNTAGCTTGCAGSTTGDFVLKNYNKNLFEGGTPDPTPFVGYSSNHNVAPTPGSTIYDSANDITFAMISQTGTYNNVWTSSDSDTLTIPMGVFGVQNVWTMLNNYYGADGVVNTSVTFTFDDNADGSDANSLTTLTVDLKNGTEIRSSVDCTANCGTTEYASTLASGATVVNGSDIHCTGANCIAAVTVLANNLFSALNLTPNPSTQFGGQIVTAVLDDQGFFFGNAFANQYLVSVGITENGYGVSGSTASATALSAITVETFDTTAASTATPEPSTVLLVIGGLAGFAFIGRRRRLS